MLTNSPARRRTRIELGFQIVAALCIVVAGLLLDGTAGKVVIVVGVLATATWIVLMLRRERGGSRS